MDQDSSRPTTPTRREYLTYGGALVAGSVLAGCTGDSDSDTDSGESTTPDTTETTEPTTTATDEQTETPDQSYTVEMAPVGEVQFEQPPERVTHYFPDYGDMAVALGHGDSILSMGLPSRFHTDHYDELDGVSVDTESITGLNGDNGIDKEIFYELDGDLHLIDPQWLINNTFFGLEEADVEELTENVAPFIGNTIFRRTDEWHDYRYYTLYEAFGKLATVFQREDRYEAFVDLHEEFQNKLDNVIPPESERPNVAFFWAGGDEPEEFLPYVMNEGTSFKQWNDLSVGDALAESDVQDFHSNRAAVDYETLLEIDPEVLLLRGQEAKTTEEFQETTVSYFQDHNIASQLTAVQNGDVYRGGPLY
jgi:iron complex transport system substrate-binding protein